MDRIVLQQHLDLAQRHAAEGRRHLARQEELIAKLRDHGHDFAQAIEVLDLLRETQALHEQDVKRLSKELE
ncbi:hypothetical protein JQ615_36810 [Bradyrhizobium jicamae]|uniref:Uncharacterized protein n=1 Tax=Bradyrhizobium jicamae TaxID=280332 RepID=A0ABS5FVV6_9BRAD|nr:hypothetical protein [Bradyrhizobium jicamae]MBR0800939.1 hypothetical protein [Bradyrhizobium jicamae]